MVLTLVVCKGTEVGREISVAAGDSISVGRSAQADATFSQQRLLSSLHFEVECTEDGTWLNDCNSTNGTMVNGTLVQKATLLDQDRISAGGLEFLVCVGGQPEPSTVEIGSRRDPTDSADRGGKEAADVESPGGFNPFAQIGAAEKQDVTDLDDSGSRPIEARTGGVDFAKQSTAGLEMVQDMAPSESDDGQPANGLINETGLPAGVMLWESPAGKAFASVIVKATFDLCEQPQLSAEQWDLLESDEPFDEEAPELIRLETDFVPFKPRTDIVVVGHVYAPRGIPVTELDSRISVGRTSKTIRVFGDRQWLFSSALDVVPRITAPKNFVEMEISYARAYGGFDEPGAAYCASNLAGVGCLGSIRRSSIENTTLPNFEDPNMLIHHWETKPHPQGFGFYGRGWMPRLRNAGTYDAEHIENRAPLAPKDMSLAFYNGAHPDLQVDGYLRGGESVELVNLSKQGNMRFTLPTLELEVEAMQGANAVESGTQQELGQIPKLDTVVFLPDESKFYLVYRAVVGLPNLDSVDVSAIRIISRE